MATPANPGEHPISRPSDAQAEGALANFYITDFSMPNHSFSGQTDAIHQMIFHGHLPKCPIGGNSAEDGISEFTSGDCTITKDLNKKIVTVESGDSSFTQTGIGDNADRVWSTNNGSEMIARSARMQHHPGLPDYDAKMQFGDSSGGKRQNREYDFDTHKGMFWRRYSRWTVSQQTESQLANKSAPPSEEELNINVSGDGMDKTTSLSFTANQFTYNAQKDGILISTPDGVPRFLWSGGRLFKLDAITDGAQTQGDFFTTDDGKLFKKLEQTANDQNNFRGMSLDALKQMFSIDNEGAVIIDGLKVIVDRLGNVSAQTDDSDSISISIGADGSQSVTSADGYTTKVAINGMMTVYGPDGKCLGFFDPTTGIIGNDHIQLAADFSNFDGRRIDMNGIVLESSLTRSSQQAFDEANKLASVAVQNAGQSSALAKEHIDCGTIDSGCLSALSSSLSDLNNALGQCIAAGARDNLAAIISSMGLVSSQLTLAQQKFMTQRVAQNLGVSDHFMLAQIQRGSGGFADSRIVANQAAESLHLLPNQQTPQIQQPFQPGHADKTGQVFQPGQAQVSQVA